MKFLFRLLFSFFEFQRIRYTKKELNFKSKRVKLGGVEVYFLERQGNPNLPTIVLVHGFLDACYGFRKLVKHLQYPGRILIADLPGYGRSKLPEVSYLYQLDIISDLLYESLQVCGLTSCILVGHSMGGLICQRLVLKNQNEISKKHLLKSKNHSNSPQLTFFSIDGLVLLASGGIPHPKRDEMRSILFPTNFNDIDRLLSNLYASKFPKPSWILKKTLLSAWDVPRNHYLAENSITREKEIFFGNKAKAIKIPTLIVGGDGDQLTTTSMMKSFHRWIKNSELVILPHSKHAIHMEKPELVAHRINHFIATNHFINKKANF
jgi:pimeloyl-ACP methyl ester carboxylesterase